MSKARRDPSEAEVENVFSHQAVIVSSQKTWIRGAACHQKDAFMQGCLSQPLIQTSRQTSRQAGLFE